MKYDYKELVGNGKKVTFVKYRQSEFIYRCDNGFEFTIPLEDTDGAVLLDTDNAMLYLTYIKKFIKKIQAEENA